MANAAVFPVPVWAQPRKSFIERIVGMALSCIGVGLRYHSSVMARLIGSIIGRSQNSMKIMVKYLRTVS